MNAGRGTAHHGAPQEAAARFESGVPENPCLLQQMHRWPRKAAALNSGAGKDVEAVPR